MRISTKGRYGLRAIADIASETRKGSKIVSLKSISKRQGISENYLEQIVAVLRNNGYLNSIRGAGGGYSLAKKPEEISAGEILRALEGSLSPAECLDTPNVDLNGSCNGCKSCAARGVLAKIYSSMTDVVDSITIKDIIDDISVNDIE